MKNYEKYAEEIKNYKGETFCKDFIIPVIHENCDPNCERISCERCNLLQMIWLLKEYEKPEIDWSRVSVDTPILVRNLENDDWLKRYFAKYENGIVYTWKDGCTSWSTLNNHTINWKYAKLAEECETE